MQQKTQGAKRRKYDASFKEEVLKMIHNGRSASEVAQSLGIGENLIYKWKSRSSQQPAAVGKGEQPYCSGNGRPKAAGTAQTHPGVGAGA